MIEREAYSEEAIARRLTQLLVAILVGFGLVALALGYWSVLRSAALADRLDNPRLVEAELRVQRGRILDRSDNVLAENAGSLTQQVRNYPLAEAGPAVGHYNLRYGATGIEASYDAVLRGSGVPVSQQTVAELLHIAPVGQNVRLSLDADLQRSATRLLAGQQGALVLLELNGGTEMPTADIRAMVSQPWYDPAELEVLFEDLGGAEDVSLFNRATQGQYQPGLVLFPLLVATAIDNDIIEPAATVANANRPVDVDSLTQRCMTEPETESVRWLEAVGRLCPGAAAELGELMGIDGLISAIQSFGLLSSPAIPIPAAEADVPDMDDLTLAALGQETLTVSPLQTALAYSTLVDGRLPSPRLVDALQSADGAWQPVELERPVGPAGPAITSTTASLVRQALTQADAISGLSVPVLSAPGGQVNQWYVGLAPSQSPRFVVVVILEQPEDPDAAALIGQTMLAEALRQP